MAPPVDTLPPYRAVIEPGWIDYNGHVRDAYYTLVLSYAIDELMDHVGLHAAYRQATHCTLYSVEIHLRFLREIKADDELSVATSVLEVDSKRLLVGSRFNCPRLHEPAALAEVLLLHVAQQPKPASTPFPAEVAARLARLECSPAARAAWPTVSRKLELRRG